MSNSFRVGVGQWLITAAAAVAALALAYTLGRTHGATACEARATRGQLQTQGLVITQARAELQRSATVGRGREADSAHIDAFFHRLAEEAAHASPDPVDRCELPAERLRLWAAANAGAFAASAPTLEHNGGAAAAARPELGPAAGPGGEPPGGGAPVSPAGQPALPAAAAPAGDAS